MEKTKRSPFGRPRKRREQIGHRQRTALITGITGQDGSFLAEFLLGKGYEVHGMIRRASNFNTQRIDHLVKDVQDPGKRVVLHYGDITDGSAIRRVLELASPSEVYNLAGQSHVRVSFDQPEYTADTVGLGTLRLLEALREYAENASKAPRFYQAGSSEMFGSSPPPQNESTPFRPESPYAVAKVFAHQATVNYREAYGLFACNGILFNHESPRRGETFVTRKITRAATRIKLGLRDRLYLGNLEARRDWGYAGDYVEPMWMMLQARRPGDYAIATGESHSVREFVETVFAQLDLDWRKYVRKDPRYLRPSDPAHLKGDASKARRVLGWHPRVGFDALVRRMVEADLRLAERERMLADAGHAEAPPYE